MHGVLSHQQSNHSHYNIDTPVQWGPKKCGSSCTAVWDQMSSLFVNAKEDDSFKYQCPYLHGEDVNNEIALGL